MPTLPAAFRAWPLAHRGLHDASAGCPENGLSAFRAAIAAGYGIECDVRLAACGTAMVFHDPTLDRTTGMQGPLPAHDAKTLGRIALRGGDGEGIPTLAALLACIAGRVPLLVELKDPTGTLGPGDAALVRAVGRALDGYDGPVAAMSFNPAIAGAVATALPHLPCGRVTGPFAAHLFPDVPEPRRAALRRLPGAPDWPAGFVGHDRRDIANPALGLLRDSGTPVFAWTVRSAAEEAEARRHADAIIFEGYRPRIAASAA